MNTNVKPDVERDFQSFVDTMRKGLDEEDTKEMEELIDGADFDFKSLTLAVIDSRFGLYRGKNIDIIKDSSKSEDFLEILNQVQNGDVEFINGIDTNDLDALGRWIFSNYESYYSPEELTQESCTYLFQFYTFDYSKYAKWNIEEGAFPDTALGRLAYTTLWF